MLHAAAVITASGLFLPGVLVRIACQELAAKVTGMRVERRGFLTELGGEVEHTGGEPAWTALLLATIVGPVLIGSVLLAPFAVRWTLLDVRPFASLAVDNLILSKSTSALPLLETSARLGFAPTLRLWFGISCFYCSIPSRSILVGAREANQQRRRWTPTRLLLTPVTGFFRGLRAIDSMLTYVFAGAYLASGLIILLLSWRLLSAITSVVI